MRLRTEMTHGDKAKAKAAKTSQASAQKSSSKTGKVAAAGSGEKGGKAGGAKGGGPAAQKGGAEKGEARGKGRVPAAGGDSNGGFNNPTVAAAFKLALKKYPNAFRKLTD
jgi:hypothetical protein